MITPDIKRIAYYAYYACLIVMVVSVITILQTAKAIVPVLAYHPQTPRIVADFADWKTYHNDVYGFNFRYPADWDFATYLDNTLDKKTFLSKDTYGSLNQRIGLGHPSSGLTTYSILATMMANPGKLSSEDFAAKWLKEMNDRAEADGGQGGVMYKSEQAQQYGTNTGYQFNYVFGYDQSFEDVFFTSDDLAFLLEVPVSDENPNISQPAQNHAAAVEILSTFKFTTAAKQISYQSREDCEKQTGRQCGFNMCDVPAPGKTLEETCPSAGGWVPIGQTLCHSNSECASGLVCYISQYVGMGPNGAVTGPQEGDQQCHRSCTKDSDCSTGSCLTKTIFQGDVQIPVQFCSN